MIPTAASAPCATRRSLSCALLVALGLGLSGAPAVASKAPKTPKPPKTSGGHRAAKKERVEERGSAASADTAESPESAILAGTPEPVYNPVPVDPNRPSVISVAPHFSPQDRLARQARESERARALAPRAEAWSRAFRAEGAPFVSFVDQALRTLRTAIGRGSRNVCYPLQLATERLAAALPEAPEPRLETEIRGALSQVANGARICLEGRPTTAQTEIGRGAETLARAAEAIVNWGR